MTYKEDAMKNTMEQAFELSLIFSEILSFKDALSLTTEESQFLFDKFNEASEAEETLKNVIDGIGNHEEEN